METRLLKGNCPATIIAPGNARKHEGRYEAARILPATGVRFWDAPVRIADNAYSRSQIATGAGLATDLSMLGQFEVLLRTDFSYHRGFAD